jgi:hypothetical protein
MGWGLAMHVQHDVVLPVLPQHMPCGLYVHMDSLHLA